MLMPTSLQLAALEVAIMTNSIAANDEKVDVMTTLVFKIRSERLIWIMKITFIKDAFHYISMAVTDAMMSPFSNMHMHHYIDLSLGGCPGVGNAYNQETGQHTSNID